MIHFGVFVAGVAVGLGFANRLYVARHQAFTKRVGTAIDSIDVKRGEFLNLTADVKSLEVRIRQLEVARQRSP